MKGSFNASPELSTRPPLTAIATQRGWTCKQILKHLGAVPTGRDALAFLHEGGIALEVWKSGHIRNWYRSPGDAEWWEYYVFGLTTYRNETIHLVLSDRMDPFTAAATFVHELEHARGWVTEVGGTEVDARLADMKFYVEHGALDQLPQEYFHKKIVVCVDGVYRIDEARLREEADTHWNAQSGLYETREYEFGEMERIDSLLRCG